MRRGDAGLRGDGSGDRAHADAWPDAWLTGWPGSLVQSAAGRLSRWTDRPYATLIIAATVALTLVDGVANRGASHLMPLTSVLIALFVVETYWWPASSALAIVVASVAVVMAPRVVLPIPVWALWYVYGMLAYRRRHGTLAAVLLLGIVGTAGGVALGRYPLWTVSSIISLDGSFVLAAIAGYALAERRDVERARRLAEENERIRRDVELGSRIHDSVTQGLTAIALTGDRLRGELAGAGTGAIDSRAAAALHDVDTIVDTAHATLTQVRTVIDALGNAGDGMDGATAAGRGMLVAPVAPAAAVPDDPDTPARSRHDIGARRLDALRGMARDGDARLHALGFEGRIAVDVEGDDAAALRLARLSDAAWSELADLLGQLVTNVMLHAAPEAGAYAIETLLGADGVTVRQFNGVFDGTGAASAASVPHSGKGLALHRARLEALGGDLRTSGEDGVWILVARIPWRAVEPISTGRRLR